MGNFSSIPRKNVSIDAAIIQGPFEGWRHSIGHGGVNRLPLPERVVAGAAKLRPRLVRTFIQEYFNIYPEHGVFDWSRLDPYMDALARTGAKVIASIDIKPKVLYPEINQAIWKPNDTEEWQSVIRQLVKRYSVDKQIVTYWEVGNETDIGEWGGCPYLIPEPEDYYEYYVMTMKPILEVFPEAKVGGPAIANCDHKLMKVFIDFCSKNNTQLDFVSWHIYSDDLQLHGRLVRKVKEQLEVFPGKRPEMMITELNKSFDPVSVEEMAFEARRAAIAGAIILTLMDAGLDWSFYYHVWDQAFYPEDFADFYSDTYIMTKHWNEIPHRFGMFGVNEEVRPQYFLYQMLNNVGDNRIAADCDDADIIVRGGSSEGKVSAFMINYNSQVSHDVVLTIDFKGLKAGHKMLKTYRIDNEHRWSSEKLELLPVEQREVVTGDTFNCQMYSPSDSVLLVVLEDI